MWSINVFKKDIDGSYSVDQYESGNKWSYDDFAFAQKVFDNIPVSYKQETFCELMEYNFETTSLVCIQSKYSNHNAINYIIPGKYQDEIN